MTVASLLSALGAGALVLRHLRGAMSALPPKADMRAAQSPMSHYGPIADIEGLGGVSNECRGARQNNLDFGELTRLRIDFD